jgi:hypothetical protein
VTAHDTGQTVLHTMLGILAGAAIAVLVCSLPRPGRSTRRLRSGG